MWSASQVADATKGRAQGSWNATRIAIDSRAIQAGDLFVALKGERFDGHDYVDEALKKGAVAVLVSDLPESKKTLPHVLVDDTTKALVDLAVYNRARSKAKVIGVTGSVGKTGTKEALKIAFSVHGVTYATQGNLNNHIGLPLCLANLSTDTQFAIFEMGMNHAGEISYLTRLVHPDVAIITTVEAVHLEFFDSVEAIADAKSEIMEGLPEYGVIVLNRDNRYYARCEQNAKKLNVSRIMDFGSHAQAAFRLLDYQTTKTGSRMRIATPEGEMDVSLGVIGRHWAMNALATLAAVHATGQDVKRSADALREFAEPEGRGKFYPLPVPEGKGEYILIDDCYNASPSSMSAAFAKLEELSKGGASPHRRIAVLGDMLELGIRAPQFHAELSQDIALRNIDKVYVCGPLMKHLYDALDDAKQGGYAPDSASLLALVMHDIREYDIVLIKGSNGSKMKIIRDALKAVAYPTKEKQYAV
jgi:UDP-N-acetylmuramoyl-tripeptide--D-alanyl-D-alanine ligase